MYTGVKDEARINFSHQSFMERIKNKTWVIVSIVVIVGGLTWYLQSHRVIQPVAGEPVRIGSILILSGEGASWGTASKNGIDLAVEQVNATGGIHGRPLMVSHQDDKGDPKAGIDAFRQLTDAQGISIIIGTTWTRTGLPLIDLAQRKKVLMISPSLGVKEFNEGSEYLFNTWPHDYILSEKLADFVFRAGHRKVALIGAQDPWVKDQTSAFRKQFESLGGSVTVLVEPVPADKDINSEALKIKNTKGLDALISTTDGVQVGALVAKRLRALGVTLPLYSITIDNDVIKAAGKAYEGMKFLTFLTPTHNFETMYRKKFGKDLDIGADSAYDAVMMLVEAMRKINSTDATALKQYLATIKTYSGVSGELVSDGKRGFTKAFVIKEIRDGKPVTVSQ